MELTKLSDKVAVSGQILASDVADVAAAGFRGIINNRPDGEAAGQPTSAELEAEARKHGLAYWHIPIVPGEAKEADARAFTRAIEQAGGPVLAFCRTGNRSTQLGKMAGIVG